MSTGAWNREGTVLIHAGIKKRFSGFWTPLNLLFHPGWLPWSYGFHVPQRVGKEGVGCRQRARYIW